MRVLRLDQYELDRPESEQELVFCQGEVRQFDSPETFYRATCKLSVFETKENLALPPPRHFSEAMRGRFYDFLSKESDFSLRGDMPAHVVADTWDCFDVVIVETNGGRFARLMWFTSA